MPVLTVRVASAVKERLQEAAGRDGRSLSDFVRRAFEQRVLPALDRPQRRRPRSTPAGNQPDGRPAESAPDAIIAGKTGLPAGRGGETAI